MVNIPAAVLDCHRPLAVDEWHPPFRAAQLFRLGNKEEPGKIQPFLVRRAPALGVELLQDADEASQMSAGDPPFKAAHQEIAFVQERKHPSGTRPLGQQRNKVRRTLKVRLGGKDYPNPAQALAELPGPKAARPAGTPSAQQHAAERSQI